MSNSPRLRLYGLLVLALILGSTLGYIAGMNSGATTTVTTTLPGGATTVYETVYETRTGTLTETVSGVETTTVTETETRTVYVGAGAGNWSGEPVKIIIGTNAVANYSLFLDYAWLVEKRENPNASRPSVLPRNEWIALLAYVSTSTARAMQVAVDEVNKWLNETGAWFRIELYTGDELFRKMIEEWEREGLPEEYGYSRIPLMIPTTTGEGEKIKYYVPIYVGAWSGGPQKSVTPIEDESLDVVGYWTMLGNATSMPIILYRYYTGNPYDVVVLGYPIIPVPSFSSYRNFYLYGLYKYFDVRLGVEDERYPGWIDDELIIGSIEKPKPFDGRFYHRGVAIAPAEYELYGVMVPSDRTLGSLYWTALVTAWYEDPYTELNGSKKGFFFVHDLFMIATGFCGWPMLVEEPVSGWFFKDALWGMGALYYDPKKNPLRHLLGHEIWHTNNTPIEEPVIYNSLIGLLTQEMHPARTLNRGGFVCVDVDPRILVNMSVYKKLRDAGVYEYSSLLGPEVPPVGFIGWVEAPKYMGYITKRKAGEVVEVPRKIHVATPFQRKILVTMAGMYRFEDMGSVPFWNIHNTRLLITPIMAYSAVWSMAEAIMKTGDPEPSKEKTGLAFKLFREKWMPMTTGFEYRQGVAVPKRMLVWTIDVVADVWGVDDAAEALRLNMVYYTNATDEDYRISSARELGWLGAVSIYCRQKVDFVWRIAGILETADRPRGDVEILWTSEPVLPRWMGRDMREPAIPDDLYWRFYSDEWIEELKQKIINGEVEDNPAMYYDLCGGIAYAKLTGEEVPQFVVDWLKRYTAEWIMKRWLKTGVSPVP